MFFPKIISDIKNQIDRQTIFRQSFLIKKNDNECLRLLKRYSSSDQRSMTSSQLFFLRDINKNREIIDFLLFKIMQPEKSYMSRVLIICWKVFVGFCGLFIHKRTVIDQALYPCVQFKIKQYPRVLLFTMTKYQAEGLLHVYQQDFIPSCLRNKDKNLRDEN